jgi:hypothetical protein
MLRAGFRQHSRALHYRKDRLLGCHSWQPGAAAAGAARHVPPTLGWMQQQQKQQQQAGIRQKHGVATNAASG